MPRKFVANPRFNVVRHTAAAIDLRHILYGYAIVSRDERQARRAAGLPRAPHPFSISNDQRELWSFVFANFGHIHIWSPREILELAAEYVKISGVAPEKGAADDEQLIQRFRAFLARMAKQSGKWDVPMEKRAPGYRVRGAGDKSFEYAERAYADAAKRAGIA